MNRLPAAVARRALAATTSLAVGITICAGATPAAAATSVTPVGPAVAGEYVPAGVTYTGQWVWSMGAWLRDGLYQVVDTASATRTDYAGDWKYGATSGLVSDNPGLFLSIEPATIYQWAGAWLVNLATGARTRVDTAADGTPLTPAWASTCDEECGQTGNPSVQVGPESISRDGRFVAFCANYSSPRVFDFYLKDLATGALSVRPGLCAAGGPDAMRTEHLKVHAPEMSNTGNVVHVRGALDSEVGHFYNDSLVFRSSGRVRTINGQGSMTRDGGSVFIRIGSYQWDTVDRTKGRVGVYNVKTRKTKKLAGKYRIYGTDALEAFSAPYMASMRGRFVAYGDRFRVKDRKTGRTYNIGNILASYGYPAPLMSQWQPLVNGGGTVVVARSGDQYVAVRFR